MSRRNGPPGRSHLAARDGPEWFEPQGDLLPCRPSTPANLPQSHPFAATSGIPGASGRPKKSRSVCRQDFPEECEAWPRYVNSCTGSRCTAAYTDHLPDERVEILMHRQRSDNPKAMLSSSTWPSRKLFSDEVATSEIPIFTTSESRSRIEEHRSPIHWPSHGVYKSYLSDPDMRVGLLRHTSHQRQRTHPYRSSASPSPPACRLRDTQKGDGSGSRSIITEGNNWSDHDQRDSLSTNDVQAALLPPVTLKGLTAAEHASPLRKSSLGLSRLGYLTPPPYSSRLYRRFEALVFHQRARATIVTLVHGIKRCPSQVNFGRSTGLTHSAKRCAPLLEPSNSNDIRSVALLHPLLLMSSGCTLLIHSHLSKR